MCNLYKTRKSVEEIARLFQGEIVRETGLANLTEDVFPGLPGIVIREDQGKRRLRSMIWGFPLVTREMRVRAEQAGKIARPKPVNNARDLASPFWRSAAVDPARRCLIPVERFAEAAGEKGRKTRTWFAVKDQPVFAWAGLWRPSAEWGDVYAGVMTEANAAVAPVHERMPVILARDDHERWLNGSFDEILALQRPFTADAMTVDPTAEPWGGYKGGEGRDLFSA
jgi:putative SOS response-associated peptidase YedK